MQDLAVSWIAPAVLALLPAAFRLRRGQALVGDLEHPAFAEKLLTGRTLLAVVFVSVAAIEVVFWPRRSVLMLPLQLLTFMAAGWPLRRAMLGERWSVGAYLWFYVRMVVAIYGFWILLMVTPWLAHPDGLPAWAAPAGLALVLLVWNARYADVMRVILRMRPVTTPSLVTQFGAVVAKTTVPNPSVEYVDVGGGVFANAIALPSRARPGVGFTSTVLERFDEDEVVAIFAHEIAHLEHLNDAYLKKYQWAGWAIVLAAAGLTPLIDAVAPRLAPATYLWPFLVLMYVAVLTQRRQQHETESDLRAVALTGNPDALMRGLIKLHAMAKMPRRLDPNVEVVASHPSLARRIQAIREASGVAASRLDEPLVLQHGVSTVTLFEDRLVWNQDAVTSHTFAYAALDELRIEAIDNGAMRLIASDPEGRKWTLALSAEDVPRVQRALDVIDSRLRPTPSARGQWDLIGQLTALLCVVAAIGAAQFAALLVAAIASAKLERPLIRAAGVAAIVGGLLGMRGAGEAAFPGILIASGLLLFFISTRNVREGDSRVSRRLIWVLAALAIVALLPIALARGNILATHQAARDWPASGVLALAFAAATARSTPRWRAAAAMAGIAGAASAAIGSTRVLDGLLRDPFLAQAPSLNELRLPDQPASEFSLDVFPSELLVSPNGRAIAVIESDEDDDHRSRIHFGRPGGPLTRVTADDVLFVDDDRLLITIAADEDTLLRFINVDDAATPLWELELDLANARLAFDSAHHRWQILGYASSLAFVQVSGTLDGAVIAKREWPFGTGQRTLGSHQPLWTDGTRLLIATKTYKGANDLAWLGMWTYWLNRFSSETRVSLINDGGPSELFHSPLEVNCEPARDIGGAAICSASDGSRARLARVNGDGSVTLLAQFQDYVNFAVGSHWVTGWSRSPFAIDLRSGEVLRAPHRRNGEGRPAALIGASENVVAVAWTDRSEDDDVSLKVRLYQRSAIR